MHSPGELPLLVVEDDGLIRLDLVDTLLDGGYSVVEASNADEAWTIIQKTRVLALVTDIDMPGTIDGLELARRVYEAWPDCKIIVISGRQTPSADKLPKSARFLLKPLAETTLFKCLAELGVTSGQGES